MNVKRMTDRFNRMSHGQRGIVALAVVLLIAAVWAALHAGREPATVVASPRPAAPTSATPAGVPATTPAGVPATTPSPSQSSPAILTQEFVGLMCIHTGGVATRFGSSTLTPTNFQVDPGTTDVGIKLTETRVEWVRGADVGPCDRTLRERTLPAGTPYELRQPVMDTHTGRIPAGTQLTLASDTQVTVIGIVRENRSGTVTDRAWVMLSNGVHAWVAPDVVR